jgi:hypothetical protein
MSAQTYVTYRLLFLIFCAVFGIAVIHLAYLFALFNYLLIL